MDAIGGCARRWLVPDLIGHGRSDISSDIFAYKMESQARAVVQMLVREGTRRCALVAHSKSSRRACARTCCARPTVREIYV
jgi:pimeloyl-ACP methyl ester carboxylesterase